MYFIDIQGTLIKDSDKTPIEGAVEFIRKLNSSNTPYMLITNNTKQSSDEFVAFLQHQGFEIEKTHYIDPLMVLEQNLHVKKIAPFGVDAFVRQIEKLGYSVDFTNPEVVLVAIKKDFFPDDYAKMIELLLKGANLVGMHETSLYAKENKRYPGVGAILKMLQFATQKEYEVVGKPSRLFYQSALEKLQLQNSQASFEQITIVSDDLVGDLIGAKKLGMKTVFVTSGKIKNANEILPNIKKENHPHEIYSSVAKI